ncbi:MAG: hypothetical protein VZR00_07595, partial [Lachnospiraceae bacterium]|nr:hypothetical protein [Lachnospiraceae bacterium]
MNPRASILWAKGCKGGRRLVNFSLFDGFLGALFCHFYKLITLGSGEGIAEIYYLNGHGILVSEATG